MTEREALVAAIAANPDDDTPRLVFADWLDEYGEPDRAEFVRLQCEAARSGLPVTWSRRDVHPRRAEWDRRARELFADGWQRWFAPFFDELGLATFWPHRYKFFFADTAPASDEAVIGDRTDEEDRDAGQVPVGRLFVARGFSSWLLVELPAGALAGAFRREPVTSATFSNLAGWGCVSGPELRQLRTLGLRIPTRPSDPSRHVAAVFDDPHLAGVRTLNIGPDNGSVAAGVLERLVASPLGRRLRRLKCSLWEDGLAVLAAAPADLPWESVSFRMPVMFRHPLREAVAAAFALPFRGNLRELDLTKSSIGDAGAAALAASDGWDHLERLDLTDTNIGDEGLRALASAPWVGRLTHLRIWRNRVTDAGVRALADSLDPARVREFAVRRWGLSEGLLGELLERFGPRLVED